MIQKPVRICILGGGFGGLYTALRLSDLYWLKVDRPEITLVDQSDRFLFSPLLYELMTGELQSWEIAPPYAELLADTPIRFLQDTVMHINLDQRQVQLTSETVLEYDRLVLALGGETPLAGVPGVAEYALLFRRLADAYRLEERLRTLEHSDADKIRIAIVGGGYSGIELACKLADRLGQRGRIRIIEQGSNILRSSPEFNRDVALRALKSREIWLDLETQVEAIQADSLSLIYKGKVDVLPVDIVLWTIGTQMHPAIAALPVAKNSRQQIQVNAVLQVPDRPEVFALGDLADCQDADGQPVPANAQAAFQQADYTAWNLWASITDRPLLPFRYFYQGEMMTLGAADAALTGLGLKLEGIPAHLVRRLAYLSRMPTLDHQLKVGLNWLTQPLRSLLQS